MKVDFLEGLLFREQLRLRALLRQRRKKIKKKEVLQNESNHNRSAAARRVKAGQ